MALYRWQYAGVVICLGYGRLLMGNNANNNQILDAGKGRIRSQPYNQWPVELQSMVEGNGLVPRLYQVLSCNPELFAARMSFGRYIQRDSSLSAVDRELLVLRVAWRTSGQYVWGRHKSETLLLGLTESQVNQAAESGAGNLLFKVVDELIRDQDISDTTWEQLAEQYSEKQRLDIIFTVLGYQMTAVAAKALRIPAETGDHPLPDQQN